MAICVYFGLVFAEKFKNMVTTLFYRLETKKGTTKEVFPTPDYPVIRIGFLFSSSN